MEAVSVTILGDGVEISSVVEVKLLVKTSGSGVEVEFTPLLDGVLSPSVSTAKITVRGNKNN